MYKVDSINHLMNLDITRGTYVEQEIGVPDYPENVFIVVGRETLEHMWHLAEDNDLDIQYYPMDDSGECPVVVFFMKRYGQGYGR